MTNAEIQPALTPEQWEQRYIGDAAATDDAVSMGDGFDSVSFSGHQRHALAALCLYGQPFGFTHADVRLLREIAEAERGIDAMVLDLADRIAALLPPNPAHESTPNPVPGQPAPR